MARYSSEIVAVITAVESDSAPSASTLRVALYGGMYDDTVNPSGPRVHYAGRIKSDVVLEKKIGVSFWNEDSEIDFGYLDIAIEDQDADIVDFAKKVTIATVDLYRVNLSDPNADQLSLIASARSSDIGFVNENTVRLRLESTLAGAFDAPINELYYDSTYPHLEGKPYPIAWGPTDFPIQLLPTVFVDDSTLLYHVTDVEITAFSEDIYDRGVALAETTNFVADTYGFTLNQNPDGRITVGAITTDDPEDPGNLFVGLYRLVRLAMTRAGVWGNADATELAALATAISSDSFLSFAYPLFVTQEVVSLKGFLDTVFTGASAWYYVDELSEVHFGRMSDPDSATADFAFTDANMVGDIRTDPDKAPGLSSRIDYADNPGVYGPDEVAGSVSNANKLALTNPSRVVTTTETIIPFYSKAETREPTKSAFSSTGNGKTRAQEQCDFWWSDLYPVRRRFYTVDVPMNDPAFDSGLPQLGQFVSLQSDTFDLLATAKKLLIRRLRFNFSTNLLTIEGWG